MASRYRVYTGAWATTAASTKSFWLLNPVTNDFIITEIGVSFDGAAAAAGVLCELYRVTTLGSPAGTTAVESKMDPSIPAATTTGLTKLSTEVTTPENLLGWYVAPGAGLVILQFPLGREPLARGAGARMGFRWTTPAAVAPNGASYVEFEE